MEEKKATLIEFSTFLLDHIEDNKICFQLVDGKIYAGWILYINETSILFQDSGLYGVFSDPFEIEIEEIDINTLLYSEEGISELVYYFGPDSSQNIIKSKERRRKEKLGR